LKQLEAEGIPCGAVQDYQELAEDEQARANGYIVAAEDPRLGAVRQPGPPLQLSETPGEARPAPDLGQHTEEVLSGLGYSWEKIESLRQARTIL